jgi:phosphatidylserine/phosphatidylglycerophosphate/cardiolipin synthase-like enzyme
MKPNGTLKRVPVSITNLSLDIIFKSPIGSELQMAMFALSNRVAMFGACLIAARRGVIIRIILDKKVSFKTAQLFRNKAALENLPIQVRLSNRMMHNKYLLNKDLDTVLTGTANFTTDAAERHSEHMILFTNEKALTKKFDANFNLIWSRLKE